MVRPVRFLPLLILAGLALPAHSDDWQLEKYYAVENIDAGAAGPIIRSRIEGEAWTGFYSGFRAAAGFEAEYDAQLDIYFGIRPSLLGFDLDITYNRRFTDVSAACCDTIALDFNRPLWSLGTLTGHFTLNPDTHQAATETRATFRLFENYDLDSTIRTSFNTESAASSALVNYNFSAARRFEHEDGANTRIGIQFTDTNRSSARAALSIRYSLDF